MEDSDDLPRRQSESAEHTDDTDENVEPPAPAEPEVPEPPPAQAKASGAEPSEPQPKAVPRRAPSAASEFASGRDSVRSSMKGSKEAKSTTGTEKGDVDKAKGSIEPSSKEWEVLMPEVFRIFTRQDGKPYGRELQVYKWWLLH